MFDSNVTFSSPAAVCRYLARAAVAASPQTSYYGANVLEQAEVGGRRFSVTFCAHLTFIAGCFVNFVMMIVS